MEPLRSVLFWTLLAGGDSVRVVPGDSNSAIATSFLEHGAAAASKIHEHIQNLHIDQMHHVCVSGNTASSFVDSYLLQGTGAERTPLALESKLHPDRECNAEQAQVGNVIYTIKEQIEDGCAARWKMRTKTCDVLIHASSGAQCDQLYNFRLLHENCDAELIVVYDDSTTESCYVAKMAQFQKDHSRAWCGEEESTTTLIFAAPENSASVGGKVIAALEKNAEAIRKMLKQAEGLTTNSLIERLQIAKKQSTKFINVAEELADIQHVHGGNVRNALMQLSNKMKRGPDDDVPIVVDLGSGTLRAGFAGDDTPTASFPNVVGKPKYDTAIVGSEHKDYYIGDEADAMRGVLVLKYPIKHGIVEDWDYLDMIWEHTFTNELRTTSQGKKIMITEPPLNPLPTREKLAKDLFDKYGVAGMYINNAAVLSLYAAGVQTGLAVSSGDGVTHVVPVYEGYGLTPHIKRLDLGGAQINEWLLKLLAERGEFRGNDAGSSSGHEILRNIKETQCYVAFNEAMKDKPEYNDYQAALEKAEEIVSYELPDGVKISLGHERFRCAEPMFDPLGTMTLELPSIQKLIVDVIQDCAVDVRDELYENIALSGGNSMFPGFAQRLKKEVEKLRPANKEVNIVAPPDRAIHTWIGGSVLSSLDSFNDPEFPMWFTKPEYQDNGIGMLAEKCPWQR